MNFALIKEIATIIGIIAAIVVGIVIGIRQVKEKKARRGGLQANPKRCEDHEGRLRTVEAVSIALGPTVSAIKEDVSEIKTDVKDLIKLHLKP
jgi:hypothetical protein